MDHHQLNSMRVQKWCVENINAGTVHIIDADTDMIMPTFCQKIADTIKREVSRSGRPIYLHGETWSNEHGDIIYARLNDQGNFYQCFKKDISGSDNAGIAVAAMDHTILQKVYEALTTHHGGEVYFGVGQGHPLFEWEFRDNPLYK